jgi:two-component system, NtrC family, nitrogen regulation sensor histidine kinase NtrY
VDLSRNKKYHHLKTFYRNKFFPLILAVLLFFLAHFMFSVKTHSGANEAKKFQNELHKKEKILKGYLDHYAEVAEKKTYEELFSGSWLKQSEELEKEGLVVLIYENDSLKFWTTNDVAVENYIREVCLDDRVAKLKNGWFEVVRKSSIPEGTKVIIGLILLKTEYPFQNQYLKNRIPEKFDISPDTEIMTSATPGSSPVYSENGKYLCSLKAGTSGDAFPNDIAVILDFLGILFLLKFLAGFFSSLTLSIGRIPSLSLFFLSLIFLRAASIKYHFPSEIYDLPLFSPQLYGDATSFWLQSLGDLFLNMIVLFSASYFFFRHPIIGSNHYKRPHELLFSFLMLAGLLAFSLAINELFSGLIKNSSISFNINNVFTLSRYSYIAIVIICFLLLSFFIVTLRVVKTIKSFLLPVSYTVGVITITAIIYISLSLLFGNNDALMVLWPLILIAFVFLAYKNKPFSILHVAVIILIFCLFSGHSMLKYSRIKEKAERVVLAEKLAAEQDPIAEVLFEETRAKIDRDTLLKHYMKSGTCNPGDFIKRIRQQYFSGYWEKYDAKVSLFDTSCAPLPEHQAIHSSISYFDELIKTKGSSTFSEGFYFIENNTGKVSYLARIPIHNSKGNQRLLATAFIELDSKFVSEEVGFPELLLDRDIGLSRQLSNYSYAKYRNGTLLNSYGVYQYGLSDKFFSSPEKTFFYRENDQEHLVYKAGNTLIVLSKKTEGFFGDITSFSYLFAFYSMFLLVLLLLRQIITGGSFSGMSLKYRIQLLLVLIMLISLFLFAAGTVYYINKQYEAKNKQSITEKIHSVLLEVESKMEEEGTSTPGYREYASFILKKFANVFFTDISLYDLNGNLYASSRPKLFEEGLISRKMNPEAFLNMSVYQKTTFIHNEKIGNLNYLSAYVPFKNKQGLTVSYLNLPYFAKQNELEKEIATFLVAIINIYVLLFGLSIIVAILISNYVTRPLKLIQDKLGNIKLGKSNEHIDWKEKDEIGSLVAEYNRMIDELANSAELLSRSERESAWREMARQVAHEIKNPLTPMKLSIQHLQRTKNDSPADRDKKIDSISKTLIEQIETLSAIAGEFSAFAKMPKGRNEKINVENIMQSAIDLFKNASDIEFEFKANSSNPFVNGDKDQMLRVFNNLLKNAMQAIPEGQQGKIDISIEDEANNILIKIRDNGTGISEEQMNKIFVPSFTTKTGGMGLGLAMVKNIIESFEGRIWFETKRDVGATFFISIPRCED